MEGVLLHSFSFLGTGLFRFGAATGIAQVDTCKVPVEGRTVEPPQRCWIVFALFFV